jgi:hypothetical protein
MHPIQLTRDKISYHAAMIPSRTNYITAVAVLVLQQHFVMYEPAAPVMAAAGAGLAGAPVV